MKKEYIGDDVHVVIDGDGAIILTVETNDFIVDQIGLLPDVWNELKAYVEEWQKESVKP